MYRLLELKSSALLALFALSPTVSLAETSKVDRTWESSFNSIGRATTAREVDEWDSNIRDDFQGLKSGSGSVLHGKELYEVQCLSCHGVSGTEIIVFSPLVGGFTEQDVETGVVKAFEPPISVPPSTLMRAPTLATIMDYISRAMPWDNPKSLSNDEVYALTAYILHLGGLVESNFVLSNDNVQVAQSKLPNRNAFNSDHGLWPGQSAATGGIGNGLEPDITPPRCMTGCKPTDPL